MYVASNGVKTAVILQDCDAVNPRTEYDNLGKMVCWHRRYDLGDKHSYSSPHDFAKSLVLAHVSRKDVFTAIKNGELSDFRFTGGEKEDEPYSVEANFNITSDKQKWEEVDWKVSKEYEVLEGEEAFDLEMDVLDSCGASEMLRMCSKYGDVAILPLYLYDHSGLAMSTGSFVGRAPHAEWDSGCVGFIYVGKETAMKNIAMESDTLKIAMILSESKYDPVTVQKEIGESVDQAMERNGFRPVQASQIRNLYDSSLGSEENKSLIDEYQLNHAGVFKKDRTLYVFAGHELDGAFQIQPVATFNPDLKPMTDEAWKSRAKEVLEGEVKTYDAFLNGEVYGYLLFEGLEEVDSCWGFNTAGEDIRTMFDEMAGEWGAELRKDMLKASYESGEDFDIEDYFESHDFPELRGEIRKAVEEHLHKQGNHGEPFPYGMSYEDIIHNKNGVLDDVIEGLYEEHLIPDGSKIREVMQEYAGISRELKPKLSVSDLEPDRDYTADELMALLSKKPSMSDQIAAAKARQEGQEKGQPHQPFQQER